MYCFNISWNSSIGDFYAKWECYNVLIAANQKDRTGENRIEQTSKTNCSVRRNCIASPLLSRAQTMQSIELYVYVQNDNIKFVNMYIFIKNTCWHYIIILQSETATELRRSAKTDCGRLRSWGRNSGRERTKRSNSELEWPISKPSYMYIQ